MKYAINRISKQIDRLSEWIGHLMSFLTLGMVLLTAYIVFERYVLGESTPALSELNWHLMTIIFLFGAGYVLKENQHVRVDLFYEKLGVRGQAWINLFGSFLFLIPFCALLIWVLLFSPDLSHSFVARAIQTREGSPSSGGLGTFYLLKIALPVGFGLLMLQGLSEGLKSLATLLSNEDET